MSDPNNPSPVNYADYSLAEDRRRPTSVIVLSIIGILWAAFGLICMPMFVLPFVIDFAGIPPEQKALLDSFKNDPQVFLPVMIGTVLAVIFGLILLIGSIGSLMLARFAWMTMLVYAMLTIVLGIANMVVNAVIVMPRMTAIAQQHAQPTSNGQAYFGYALGILALIYQVCIIYFYNRPKVKAAFGK